jgi:homoserine O-acetyltransferase
MDYYDPFGEDPVAPPTRFLLVSFSSDWRFGTEHSRALAAGLRANGLTAVSEHEVASPWGHDSFLLDVPEYLDLVRGFVR